MSLQRTHHAVVAWNDHVAHNRYIYASLSLSPPLPYKMKLPSPSLTFRFLQFLAMQQTLKGMTKQGAYHQWYFHW